MKTKNIVKKFKNKIGRSKIYDILKYFYYSSEFLKWLKNKEPQEKEPLYGQKDAKWYLVDKFKEAETYE